MRLTLLPHPDSVARGFQPYLSGEREKVVTMFLRRMACVVVLGCATEPVIAATPQYAATNLTPPGYLEGFFLGAGGSQAAGYGDFPINDPQVPDARDVHAFVWNQDTQTMVDLDPGGITSFTFAANAFGGYQVGQIVTSLDGGPAGSYAALWHGSAASLTLLNTPGTSSSYAYANSATHQVGNATPTGSSSSVPFVWSGSAASGHALSVPADFVDPFYGGAASDISGERIIGTASDPVGFNAAVYWPTPDAPAQVLRPADFDETFGDAIHDNHALIEGAGAIGRHLFLYNLDDGTSVDLHPTGVSDVLYSYGEALTDSEQAGFVAVADPNDPGNRFEHAAVWFGSADSFVDLHAQLGPAFSGYLYSRATGLDDAGNIYGYVFNVPTGPYLAVRWSPVPEPAAIVAIAQAAFLVLRPRR